ncbi:hypothetical protein ACIQZG_04350 [Lysinibacillus sp. NPDC096418]|uniref:hypothetical protein n=1 Tax=Lysinibacillus sp. NPDC096418 TaxID=3364138 RepID=UPI00382273A8
MTTMREQLKRKNVIDQLRKYDVHTIDGQPLGKVKYSVLLKTLALKRAADN